MVGSKARLAQEVAELFCELEESDYNEIAKKIGYKSKSIISRIVSDLEKQGLLERATKFRLGEKLSEVQIMWEGKHFLKDYAGRVVDALRDGKELTHMRTILDKYLNDFYLLAENARGALSFYQDVSPRLKSRPSDERVEELYDLIKSHDGICQSDLKKLVGGINIVRYLRKLVDNKLVYKNREGMLTLYRTK